MIVTLTPNPSVDRTLRVPALRVGEVVRADLATVEPSGKGINVARALAASGRPVTAVLPLGGPEGEHLAVLLRREELRFVGVPIAAAVRSNVTLLEPGGVATKVNEPGPRLSAAEVDALLHATGQVDASSGWTVCCGSLPPGVGEDFYARVTAQGRRRGRLVAVDSSGAPLRRAAQAGADLLAPNRDELAEASGISLHTLGDVVDAAETLRGLGAGTVLVSLGPDGAVLVDRQIWHAEPPPVRVVSSVGAGDALLAGFLAAGAVGPAALRAALAWAAACCGLPNSRVPAAAPQVDPEVPQIVVHDQLDVDRRLTSLRPTSPRLTSPRWRDIDAHRCRGRPAHPR